MWRKAALAVLWVAGVTVVALRFGGGYEERSVDSARLHVTVLPGGQGEDVPAALQMDIEAEITRGGGLVRLVMEAGDVPKANPSGPEVELILDGTDEVYFHVLADRPKLPGGASWILMDGDEAEENIPGIEGMLRLVDSEKFLTTMETPDVEPSGTETVGGVATTRYDDVVGLSGEFEEMRAATGDELEITVWLDDEGFTRRFEVPVAASYLAPRRPDDETIVLQYTLTDLGEDIQIDLPEGDDVTTL